MGNSKSKQGQSDDGSAVTADDEATEPEQLSYYQMIKHGYNELVNAIIRPPRCNYEMSQLGPQHFDFGGKQFERVDFELLNQRGLRILCSMWQPTAASRHNAVLPCVIYMHGNSSARVEALAQLSLVLSLGATLVSFDFCGSGQSDGNYVSLGFFEKDDLKCVIEYLRDSGTTSTIALWGRSMGAATALLHGERDPSIAGMVLDSAFTDLQLLAEEMVEKGRQNGLIAPGFMVKMAIRMIRSSVLKTAGFDIRLLSPVEHADRCFIPTLFVAASGDDFVPPHHSRSIYEKYAGDKNIIIVDGDHNSQRPSFLFDSALIFLVHVLQIPESWMLTASGRPNVGLPWQERKPHHHHLRRFPQAPSGITWHDSTDGDEAGFTKELQADVRDKLFSMLGNRGHVSSSMSDNAASSSSSSSSSFTVGASSSSSSTMRNGGASIGGGSGSGNGGVGNGVRSGSGSTSGGLGGGNGPLNEIESSNQRFSKEPYDSVKVSSMENDENRNKITDLNGINIHVGNDNYYDNHEEFSDWVCTICTVINSPTDEMCLTCETLRHQDE